MDLLIHLSITTSKTLTLRITILSKSASLYTSIASPWSSENTKDKFQNKRDLKMKRNCCVYMLKYSEWKFTLVRNFLYRNSSELITNRHQNVENRRNWFCNEATNLIIIRYCFHFYFNIFQRHFSQLNDFASISNYVFLFLPSNCKKQNALIKFFIFNWLFACEISPTMSKLQCSIESLCVLWIYKLLIQMYQMKCASATEDETVLMSSFCSIGCATHSHVAAIDSRIHRNIQNVRVNWRWFYAHIIKLNGHPPQIQSVPRVSSRWDRLITARFVLKPLILQQFKITSTFSQDHASSQFMSKWLPKWEWNRNGRSSNDNE